jgi:hypothetical protein
MPSQVSLFCHAYTLRFEVLTVVNMLMLVIWVVMPSGLVERYRRFGGIHCLQFKHLRWRFSSEMLVYTYKSTSSHNFRRTTSTCVHFVYIPCIWCYLESQTKQYLKSKGFWQWCIICNSVLLDIVHHLYFNKITFRKLDLLPGLRLAQPGGPTARVSILPFYLKMEEDPASETL